MSLDALTGAKIREDEQGAYAEGFIPKVFADEILAGAIRGLSFNFNMEPFSALSRRARIRYRLRCYARRPADAAAAAWRVLRTGVSCECE